MENYMKFKRLFLTFFALLLVLVSCKADDSYITVFDGGDTDYVIVVDSDASNAVSSLANSLGPLFGVSPEVLSDEAGEKKLEILVGHTGRGITAEYIYELNSLSSAEAFHYLIAEKDGKIIILSDHDIGYRYLKDYIAEKYSQDNSLVIPEKCHDLITVTWEEYYKSDYYSEQLAYEEEQNQLNNELNRYDKDMENFMTMEEAIEQYRKLAASFNTADFGVYNPASFTSVNKWDAPEVYPGESHPRVLFTENSIGTIRANLTSEENSAAYATLMSDSYAPCDGIMPESSTVADYRYDEKIMKSIEAMGLRYALSGEEMYGYQAIYCLKNVLLTANIPATTDNPYRTWGHILFTSGCIYDWCYDLLTDADKTQIISACVEHIGINMQIVSYAGADVRAPIGMGTVYGHGAEAQLLRDWLTFAIAVYDEAPEIYDLVGGRLFSEYREAQNFMYASGNHWEGDNYGPYRAFFSVYANFLISRMTDGKCELLSDDLLETVLTLIYHTRPDNQTLRIGDMWSEKPAVYNFSNHHYVAFIAGSYYKNSYLKTFAYNGLNSFKSFTNNNDNGCSALMVLTMNDPSVSHEDKSDLALTRTNTFPLTSLIARSAWNDENAFMVYMNMPETYAASHQHMDCGSFQIFYKGILASDSGKYQNWGGAHHMGYTMQTVSANSLLIYNPDFEDYRNDYRDNLVYSGGQSIFETRSALPKTLAELRQHVGYNQCTSLGVANVEKDGKYLYSYMGGDMTKAYDAETVDEVTRYMLAVATDNPSYPLVFVTFDRITSDDASYRKSALIHVQEEPTITNDGFAIVTNTQHNNSGKMVVQTVMEATEYKVIGGEGKEFWLSDKLGNADIDTNGVAGSLAEYGWGRIEISPANPEKTNRMLTVMYVTDAENKSSPIRAEDISSDNLAGAMILGKAMLFPKNEKLLAEESSFTLNTAGECFVAGVSAGRWMVCRGETVIQTITVDDGTNLLSFTAGAGDYTIKPVN